MKILKILREETRMLIPPYAWINDPSFADWVRQRLLAAGFDMEQIIHCDKDKEGNRIYAQKDHEAEDIETAFVGE